MNLPGEARRHHPAGYADVSFTSFQVFATRGAETSSRPRGVVPHIVKPQFEMVATSGGGAARGLRFPPGSRASRGVMYAHVLPRQPAGPYPYCPSPWGTGQPLRFLLLGVRGSASRRPGASRRVVWGRMSAPSSLSPVWPPHLRRGACAPLHDLLDSGGRQGAEVRRCVLCRGILA